ncbi:hypothetical protein BG011_009441, partial [Mortierella polycephala]
MQSRFKINGITILFLHKNRKQTFFRVDIKLPGKGKYHALLDHLSNRTLRILTLKRLDYFGSRTPGASCHLCSGVSIISPRFAPQTSLAFPASPPAVPISLGRIAVLSQMHPELSLAIGTLERLEALHLFNFWNETKENIVGLFSGVAKPASKLRDLALMNY